MTTAATQPSPSTTSTTTQCRGTLMRPVARTFLEDRQYNIEFHGFLSNHAKHAVIALERLSSPEERVQQYWDEYTKLTPYGIALEKVEQSNWDDTATTTTTTSSSLFLNKWKDKNTWRGKKIAWQEQVVFLNQELASPRFQHATNKLVHCYAPDLIISGIAGSLTHGIIHLGWAIDAANCGGSSWMITEGLAYLNFGHLGVDPSLFSWPQQDDNNNNNADATATAKEKETEAESIMDSLIRVANVYESENLQTTWIDRVKVELNDTTNFHPELVCAGFQWELSKILSRPHAVATRMPLSLSLSSSKDSSDDIGKDDEKLWREMYYATVYLYLATRSPDPNAAAASGHDDEEDETYGNFLVLHLITSLWGLEHTVKAIAAGAAEDGDDDNDNNNIDIHSLTRRALGQFYATMICMLATSAGGFPSANALKDIQQEFPRTTLNDDDDKNDKNLVDWEPTVRKGIAEQEEHNIKLVYVMKELWHRYHQWNWIGFYHAANAFTLTPNIGPVVVDKKEEEEKHPGFKRLRAS